METKERKMRNNKAGGIVCKWIPSKGYGFIRVPGQKDDLYVHTTDILPRERKDLNIGEIVTFYINTNKKSGRTKAVRVKGNGAGFMVNEDAGFTGVSKIPAEFLTPLNLLQSNTSPHNLLQQNTSPDKVDVGNKKNDENNTKPDNTTDSTGKESKVTFQERMKPDEIPNDTSIAHHFQSDEDEEIAVSLKPEEMQLWENFKALHVSMRSSSGNFDANNNETAEVYAAAQDKCIFPSGRPSQSVNQISVPPMYMSRNSMDDDPSVMVQSVHHNAPFMPIPIQQNQMNQQDMLRMSGGSLPFPNVQPHMSYGDVPMVPVLIENPAMVPMHAGNPNIINPLTSPTMDVYPHLRMSNDGGLFPTGNNMQIQQLPYQNPGMRASYEWSVSTPMM